MEDLILKQKLCYMQNLIFYWEYMIKLCVCPYQKNYYRYLIDIQAKEIKRLNLQKCKNIRKCRVQEEFTIDELSNYDGSKGKNAYVAVNGIVYDVSLQAKWGGGTHFGLYAGKDLTSKFMSCHGGMLQILNGLPQVGILKR